MTTALRRRRSGYTLLEVLVASVLGLMLMAALFAAFELVFKSTTGGRELTAEAELSRAVIAKLNQDIAVTIGVLPPNSGGTNTGVGPGGASASSGSDSMSMTGASPGAYIPFQAGLVGSDTQMMLFASKAPKYLRQRFSTVDTNSTSSGDVLQVCYYLHSTGKGLCRQERVWATAEGVWNSTDPDRSNEEADIIVPEVTSLSFEYASGTSFTSSWDGSQGGTDGSTSMGNPRAVRLTFNLEFITKDGKTVEKTYMHTFPVRASVGTTAAAATSAAATPASGS